MYRLIWFQHLSKAAGTTVIELARQNGEQFYPRHSNANPRSEDGALIRLWDLDSLSLTAFVDECQSRGVTFVATEWGSPLFEVLAGDDRVLLLTSLRDPVERFLSSYYYSYYRGDTSRRTPLSYLGTGWIYSHPNYYTRVFSRQYTTDHTVDRSDFECARAQLALFDHHVIVERENAFSRLAEALGWSHLSIHANPTRLNAWRVLKMLLKGRIRLLLRRTLHPRRRPPAEVIAHLREQNAWDEQLYRQLRTD